MDDILKCLKAAEELKKAVLDQQNLLKKLLIVFKNPKSNYRCCPMCETIFENEYDTFEEHVISHFEAVEIKAIETGITLSIVDIIEKSTLCFDKRFLIIKHHLPLCCTRHSDLDCRIVSKKDFKSSF